MRRPVSTFGGAIILAFGILTVTGQGQAPKPSTTKPATTGAARPTTPVASHSSAGMTAEAQTALVKQYCAGCHSDRGKPGGLTLAAFDAASADDHADVAEKMIHKLRAGMMPPAGAKRPDEATLAALATALETRIDRSASLNPNPGRRPFQRL